MKSLIIALNSKYIHASLAPWYLKACCGDGCGDVKVLEFTINDSPESILASIYREKADVAAFSCYIWNIGLVLKLAGNLKKVMPRLVVILGGPEVSYDAAELMNRNGNIDFVISGEGEKSFALLLGHLNAVRNGEETGSLQLSGQGVAGIPGLSRRDDEGIITEAPFFLDDLDTIPSPYTDEMLETVGNRILYFESSRGCPYSCTYCLSPACGRVRYFSLERVKGELRRFFEKGIGQVKFVDRTFNCNKARAMEIIGSIIDMYKMYFEDAHVNGRINFHFEAAADLFDDDMLQLLSTAPAGLIQLEIGVQTVNPHTLAEINRRTDMDKVYASVGKLRNAGNIHMHLDLIAGLPHEDFESFRTSFDTVYRMKPHMLQLGFLKLLKGSALRRDASRFAYKYRDYPPYEFLENDCMDFGEVLEIKGVEELVERYYNSGRFANTLDYLIAKFSGSAYDFYLYFYRSNLKAGQSLLPAPLAALYDLLYRYASSFLDKNGLSAARELMKLDYLASESSGKLPPVLFDICPERFRDRCFDFLKNSVNIERFLPLYTGIPAKEIYKHVHFEPFSSDISRLYCSLHGSGDFVMLFDYGARDEVSRLYRCFPVELA